MKIVRKAEFPAAGLGTRFPFAINAIPKNVTPKTNLPTFEDAAEEACRTSSM